MQEVIGLGRTAEIIAWDEGRVLKLFFEWAPMAMLERELHAAQVAFEAGVPVPRPFGLLAHQGRKGILYERVSGKTMSSLVTRQPWRMPYFIRELVRLQVGYNRIPGEGLESLKSDLAATIQRVIHGSGQEEAGKEIIARLARLPKGDRLCHMDFHPDNVMLSERGWVILDWMNARAGDPLADLARTSLMLRVAGPPPGTTGSALLTLGIRLLSIAYLREVRKQIGLRATDLDGWMLPVATARLGENIPGEKDRLLVLIRRKLAQSEQSGDPI